MNAFLLSFSSCDPSAVPGSLLSDLCCFFSDNEGVIVSKLRYVGIVGDGLADDVVGLKSVLDMLRRIRSSSASSKPYHLHFPCASLFDSPCLFMSV